MKPHLLLAASGEYDILGVLLILALVTAIAAVVILIGGIMAIFDSTRKAGIWMAGIGAVVLILSSGSCFGLIGVSG